MAFEEAYSDERTLPQFDDVLHTVAATLPPKKDMISDLLILTTTGPSAVLAPAPAA
jgi:hypothetical protein